MPGAEHHFASTLRWTGAERGPIHDYEGYSREYVVQMEGKPPLRGSAATVFRGDAGLHNPEDWLVAALSACHFLSYAALCARHGVVLVGYEDRATGTMAFDRARKVMAFTEVTLRPRCRVAAGTDVDRARALHAQAHHECFIANSVNFGVENEPEIVLETTPGVPG
jgi:organic hydroperoxide reductase OsmC/OhrA